MLADSLPPEPQVQSQPNRLAPEDEAQDSQLSNEGYESVFNSYPLQRSRLSLDSSRLFPSSFPSLKLLKLSTFAHTLDPLKRVCQYEIPGGGVCRDSGCNELHLYSRASGSLTSNSPVEDWLHPNGELASPPTAIDRDQVYSADILQTRPQLITWSKYCHQPGSLSTRSRHPRSPTFSTNKISRYRQRLIRHG